MTKRSRQGAGHVEAGMVRARDLSIRDEAKYIVERARSHEVRLVSVGPLIFFSTESGDAWVLDREDRLALCLAREGTEQPFEIVETRTQFGITWAGTFELVGDAFVYAGNAGQVRTVLGYPVAAIRSAL
jgi:hypothetical protein